MTNEEAIEILTAAGGGHSEEDWFAALDMGISALENQERMRRELKSLDGIAEMCDKLKKALELAVREIAILAKKIIPNDAPLESLVADGVNRYMKKAKIEANNDDSCIKELMELRENQAKYEKALEMAVHDSDESNTDVWCHDCPYGDDERLSHCWKCGMEYYKRKSGINNPSPIV